MSLSSGRFSFIPVAVVWPLAYAVAQEIKNPEFWGALLVGIGSVAALFYWLITGARNRRS